MSKKRLQVEGIANELRGASAFFRRVSGEAKAAQSPTQTIEEKAKSLNPREGVSQPEKELAQKSAQKIAQTFEQLSKNLSSEAIESLAFQLRKVPKNKVNTEIPLEWKNKLDDLAHELGIGKYELLMYIVGVFLGEVDLKK